MKRERWMGETSSFESSFDSFNEYGRDDLQRRERRRRDVVVVEGRRRVIRRVKG